MIKKSWKIQKHYREVDTCKNCKKHCGLSDEERDDFHVCDDHIAYWSTGKKGYVETDYED